MAAAAYSDHTAIGDNNREEPEKGQAADELFR